MPSNKFTSYGDWLNLNKEDLERIESEAESRLSQAKNTDAMAQGNLRAATAEGQQMAGRTGKAQDLQGSGRYSDYVQLRDSAKAQWAAVRAQQQGGRSLFEQARRQQMDGPNGPRDIDDESNWGSLEASAGQAVNDSTRQGAATLAQSQAREKANREMAYRQANYGALAKQSASDRYNAASNRLRSIGSGSKPEDIVRATTEWGSSMAEWDKFKNYKPPVEPFSGTGGWKPGGK